MPFGEQSRMAWSGLDRKSKIGVGVVATTVLATAGFFGAKSAIQSPNSSIKGGVFAVHVAGAVRSPQVIDGNADMVVAEAIQIAGGETEDADLNALNLAAKLQPNSQLYVPSKDEPTDSLRLGPYAAGPAPNDSSTGKPTAAAGGMVNLNTASEAELDTLPGVGPVTAKKIIEYRTSIGSFKSVDDLLNVKGIGDKKLANIRPYVTVN